MVESYYGQDLDSGHHGSGFPLPPFRQRLLEEHLQKQAAARGSRAAPRADSDTGDDTSKRLYTQEETVYSEHSWNINNLPRCKVGCHAAHGLLVVHAEHLCLKFQMCLGVVMLNRRLDVFGKLVVPGILSLLTLWYHHDHIVLSCICSTL